jgi:nitroimidazol reductase NimA-like FMN-containing flavoprotein (pyridoxamine 5'-phosphate oxidase superfamily)
MMVKMLLKSERLLKKIISSQYFAVLNSVGDGHPYSNLVAFAITSDLKSLVFITGRNTRKYRNIKENNGISILIDNRTNQPSDITNAKAITVIGTAHEETENKNALQALFLDRHPGLRQFALLPDNAMILVTIQEYIIAGLKKTQRIIIN